MVSSPFSNATVSALEIVWVGGYLLSLLTSLLPILGVEETLWALTLIRRQILARISLQAQRSIFAI